MGVVRAMDLMTPVLHRVDADTTVDTALGLLDRYRVDTLPVFARGRMTGALTRQITDLALRHGLGSRRVGDLMAAGVDVVSPNAHLETVRQRLLSGGLRWVVVGDGPREIRGIVTRTVVLHHGRVGRPRRARTADDAAEEDALAGENLTALLEKALPAEAMRVLRRVGREAAAKRSRAFLVGGTVRDLLLRRETQDLDVVVEGDAGALAREVVSAFGGTMRVHEAFRTATVFLRGGGRLDLASARTERYRAPAALPEVSPGGIRQDLNRRDFTINALAVHLTPREFGNLLDFFGSRKDLRRRTIRVMHGLSFIEDPTRAFRAVRFAIQLGFGISREAAHLIRVATEERVFERLSAARLRREVEHSLGGRRPVAAARMLAGHGLLQALHPRLRPSRVTYARVGRAEKALSWYRLSTGDSSLVGWAVTLGVLAEGMGETSRSELLERLRPGRGAARILRNAPEIVPRILKDLSLHRPLPASRVVAVCRGTPVEILLWCLAVTGRAHIRRALTECLLSLRDVRPDITGRDLVRAGVPEGPRVAVGLAAALGAKLDGRARDASAQLRVALAEIEKS